MVTIHTLLAVDLLTQDFPEQNVTISKHEHAYIKRPNNIRYSVTD